MLGILVVVGLATQTCSLQLYQPKDSELITLRADTDIAEGAFFGFSMDYVTKTNKLILGAPLCDKIGCVYECDFSNPLQNVIQTCKKIPAPDEIKTISDNKENMLYGAKVHSAKTFFLDTQVEYFACAPKAPISFKPERQFGMCSYNNGAHTNMLHNNGRSGANVYSFGWSIADGYKDTLYVGSPANSKDTIFEYFKDHISVEAVKVHWPGGGLTNNLGYSFTTSVHDKINFNNYGSSTYGEHGNGIVFRFSDASGILSVKGKNNGIHPSAMFGASLCNIEINNDNMPDLLVGAPAQTGTNSHEYNVGAVHIFLSNKNSFDLVVPDGYTSIIKGHKVGGFFGYSIANVGQARDGKYEFAISAPFEDDIGAVYIYSVESLKNKENPEYLQRIVPENGHNAMFGYHLTTLFDIDKNGYNELVVSAPGQKKVIIYKYVDELKVTFTNITKNFIRNDTIEISFRFNWEIGKAPENIKGKLRVQIQLVHKKFDVEGNTTYDYDLVELLKNTTGEEEIRVLLNKRPENKADVDEPEKLQCIRKAELIDFEDSLKYDGSQITLQSQEVSDNLTVDYGNNSVSMAMTHSFGQMKKYLVGSSKNRSITLSIVNNNGDKQAYGACARVHFSKNTKLQKKPCPQEFTNSEQKLLCPLNGTSQITFDLITSHYTSEDRGLDVEVDLYNYCSSVAPSQNDVRLHVDFEYDYNINIAGTVNDHSSSSVLIQKNEMVSVLYVYQTYMVKNIGKTNWKKINAILSFDRIDNPFYQYTSVQTYDKINLEKNLTLPQSDTLNFTLENLNINEEQLVIVTVTINRTGIDQLKSGKTVNCSTNLTLFPEITLADGKERPVQRIDTVIAMVHHESLTYPILYSVIGSIIGIALLVFILYKTGFLRRKKKEDCEKLMLGIHERKISQMTDNQKQEIP